MISDSQLLVHFEAPIEAHSNNYYGGMISPSPEVLDQVEGYDQRRRIRCSINGTPPYPCIFHKINGAFGLMVSKKRMHSNKWLHGELVDVKIYEEMSKYGMEMPEVWEEMMEQEEEVLHRFDALTPGRQRTILHYIGSAKRVETQIQRALLVSRNLKMGATETGEFVDKQFEGNQ